MSEAMFSQYETSEATELHQRYVRWCEANGLPSVGRSSFAQRQDRRRTLVDGKSQLTRPNLGLRDYLLARDVLRQVTLRGFSDARDEIAPDADLVVERPAGVLVLACDLRGHPDQQLRQDHRHGSFGGKLSTVIHRLVSLIGSAIKAAFGKRVD